MYYNYIIFSLRKMIFFQELLKAMTIIVHYYLDPWLQQTLLPMELLTEVHSMT